CATIRPAPTSSSWSAPTTARPSGWSDRAPTMPGRGNAALARAAPPCLIPITHPRTVRPGPSSRTTSGVYSSSRASWRRQSMNQNPLRSPRITHISWGRMEIEGLGRGRDFKLYPGGGREWDWTETDTHHVPGIQPADVEELLEHGSKVIVLTRGMELVLQTC